MRDIKRITATAIAAATVATGVTAVAAPSAEARIRPGNYTYTAYDHQGSKVISYPARVVGNRFYASTQKTWYDIHPTSRGGYIVAEGVNRRDFRRSGNGYVGESYMLLVPRHNTVTVYLTLVPR
ncbi:hypothetical protein GOARA_027_00450 [Gordonia araii NBRC 100433]|uniref:Uncharacterized protein n=1 Tax=Gordonia araii NBRC 100433 TaxID=1073574 RepID=G7GZQ7_9ACTN|nr:hypothetical protein [Gordonia araii]NNG98856.1 hypothetical protein [Gordonia araii NBRC 100433]GAB09082.1 hypothetical protein GOARA_027_00450 [Gordonia araii NBRC 100433]